jgi:hypothetical protein
MDACNWLLDNGVDPERIRWVRPREAWLTPRATFQPLDLIGGAVARLGRAVEALAQADSADDLFHRLEDDGQLLRIDRSVWPTMYRGPFVSDPELAALAQIRRVVRMGRVKQIESQRIVLDHGDIPTSPSHVHVDCTAYGFRSVEPRTIFEQGRITPQSFMGGFVSFSSALIGYVEATRQDLAEKNRLCVPTRAPDKPIDWIRSYYGGLTANRIHSAESDVNAWIDTSRLSTYRGMTAHGTDPDVVAGLTRMIEHVEAALSNAERLIATT